MNPEIIIAAIGAASAVAAAILSSRHLGKRNQAEAAALLTSSAISLVDELREELDAVKLQMKADQIAAREYYEAQLAARDAKIAALEMEIARHNQERDELYQHVANWTAEVDKLREGVLALVRQVRELGQEPAFMLIEDEE